MSLGTIACHPGAQPAIYTADRRSCQAGNTPRRKGVRRFRCSSGPPPQTNRGRQTPTALPPRHGRARCSGAVPLRLRTTATLRTYLADRRAQAKVAPAEVDAKTGVQSCRTARLPAGRRESLRQHKEMGPARKGAGASKVGGTPGRTRTCGLRFRNSGSADCRGTAPSRRITTGHHRPSQGNVLRQKS